MFQVIRRTIATFAQRHSEGLVGSAPALANGDANRCLYAEDFRERSSNDQLDQPRIEEVGRLKNIQNKRKKSACDCCFYWEVVKEACGV
jgi:hypothetical protein